MTELVILKENLQMGLKNKLWNRHKRWHFLKENAQARIYLVCLIRLVKASNVSLLKVSIKMEKMNISFDRVKNVIWSCLVYLNIDETKIVSHQFVFIFSTPIIIALWFFITCLIFYSLFYLPVLNKFTTLFYLLHCRVLIVILP